MKLRLIATGANQIEDRVSAQTNQRLFFIISTSKDCLFSLLEVIIYNFQNSDGENKLLFHSHMYGREEGSPILFRD